MSLFSDPHNCGTCGHACADGELCTSGRCTTCAELYPNYPDLCGQTCTSLTKDAKNCGECGDPCPQGKYCFEGVCAGCPDSAPTKCGGQFGRCTNTKTDASDCGACFAACRQGEQCVNGKCQSCPGDQCVCGGATPWRCGDQCVDLYTDKNNCGGCGNSCGANNACTNAVCDLGYCGVFTVADWSGSVTESDTDLCGGSATLSPNVAESGFALTPSRTVPGGCDVAGVVDLVQGGSICGQWAGNWLCSGSVSAVGAMSVTCSCLTGMTVTGGSDVSGYHGSWTFSESGTDDNGDAVTDSATGTFFLQPY